MKTIFYSVCHNFLIMPSPSGYLWIIFGIILLIIEMNLPGLFFFISFSFGCLAAWLLTFLGYSLFTQVIGLFLASFLAFVILRNTVRRKDKAQVKTNMAGLIHQHGYVTTTIYPHKAGRVRIKGDSWVALTQDPHPLQVGTKVKVIGINGNKIIIQILK